MALIIAAFTYINYRGASETGAIGNIVTLAKVVILALFVIFGLLAMFRTDAWPAALHRRLHAQRLPGRRRGAWA